MKREKATPTVKNVRLHTSYGTCGVEVHLNMQELFLLSMKADILGQHISWLKNQQKDIPDFAVSQLEELGYFLSHILLSAGFEPQGKGSIFCPVENNNEEEETE